MSRNAYLIAVEPMIVSTLDSTRTTTLRFALERTGSEGEQWYVECRIPQADSVETIADELEKAAKALRECR